MKELSQILSFVDSDPSRPIVLATVVQVEGSHYRNVGARLAFDKSGAVAGALGGDCLDSDLHERSASVMLNGIPELVEYDLAADDDIIFGLGQGCGGKVTILLEKLNCSRTLDHLRFLLDKLSSREVVAQLTVISSSDSQRAKPGNRLLLSKDSTENSDISDSEVRETLRKQALVALDSVCSTLVTVTFPDCELKVLVERIYPPLSLIICGAGADAVPLVRFATELGWESVVVDHRENKLIPDRFSGAKKLIHAPIDEIDEHISIDSQTAAVILTHNFRHDLELVQMFLKSEIKYIGLLGARSRSAKLLDQAQIETPNLSSADLSRIYSPIGLPIGSKSPETIALSICAEIQSVFSSDPVKALETEVEPIECALR